MSNVVRVFSVNENERETLKFETPFFHWRARYNPFDDSKTLKTENLKIKEKVMFIVRFLLKTQFSDNLNRKF